MRGDYDGMPPPSKRGSSKQSMTKEDPSIYGKLDQLAGQQVAGMEGGGGGEEQAAQMVMQAAQMLMQVGQISPQFKPLVEQVIGTLSQGVKRMAGAGGMGGMEGEAMGGMEGRMEPPSSPPKKKPKEKTYKEEDEEMAGDEYSGY